MEKDCIVIKLYNVLLLYSYRVLYSFSTFSPKEKGMVAIQCVLIVNDTIIAMSCMHQGLLRYMQRIVRVGGRPTVVAQWQSTGSSSQRSLVQLPVTADLFTSSISYHHLLYGYSSNNLIIDSFKPT